jgi:hypothetical protein
VTIIKLIPLLLEVDQLAVSKIKVNEYQCVKCGYKWINRINGKDRPIPVRCAKCKKHNWNREEDDISPEEGGIGDLYENSSLYWSDPLIRGFWDNELADKFLRLSPRPTIAELKKVVFLPGLKIGLTSQNQRRRGYIPDPQKPGWLKYDRKKYIEALQWEARKRQKLMQQLIDMRSYST